MALNLDILDRNGVGEAASTLGAYQPCLDRLTALAPISDANERLRQTLSVNLGSTGAEATRLMATMEALERSKGAILLRALPFSGATMLGLGRLSLLAAALSGIRRTFGINLLQANGPQLLNNKLRELSAGPLPHTALPTTVSAAQLAGLSQLGGSVGGLRSGLDIDILAPNAGALLRSAHGRLQAMPLFSPTFAFPVHLPTLMGMQQFGLLMSGLSAAKQTLGIDLLAADAGARLARLSAALRPGGTLAAAWAIPGFPQIGNLTQLTSLLGTVRIAQHHLGVNLLHPDAGLRLKRVFGSFAGGQVCQAADELSRQPLNASNVARLQQFAGALQASQGGGLDLMGKDAAARLASTVDGFRSGGRTAVEDLQIDDSVVTTLAALPAAADSRHELH